MKGNSPMLSSRIGRTAILAGGFFIVVFLAVVSSSGQPGLDLVIVNGRVIDPRSGLDDVRSVGIRGGKIVEVSQAALSGRQVIDAKGLTVAPGFIDLHSHGQDEENYAYKAMDGVTTALELEVGSSRVADWYRVREGKSRINFGVSAGHIPARIEVTGDTGTFLPRDEAISRRLTADQSERLQSILKRNIDEGALGIGLGIAYVPASTRKEILDVFQLAANNRLPCFVHLRSHGAAEPGSAIESAQEVIADAAATGASLHIVHVTSTGLSDTPRLIEMIMGARRASLDITTEAYPYTAAMTGLETAIFSEGWQEKMGISYDALQWVATGERLNAESFARYRKQGGMVIIHSIPEAASLAAVKNPAIIVASDGLLEKGKGHPRGAGSFARVLGYYVREKKALSLKDAISKMSSLPAQRLEGFAPTMKSKGAIKAGADADIVVFDANKVIDKATFENPAQYSEGFTHVLVGGEFVVRNGKLVAGATPGKPVRR